MGKDAQNTALIDEPVDGARSKGHGYRLFNQLRRGLRAPKALELDLSGLLNAFAMALVLRPLEGLKRLKNGLLSFFLRGISHAFRGAHLDVDGSIPEQDHVFANVGVAISVCSKPDSAAMNTCSAHTLLLLPIEGRGHTTTPSPGPTSTPLL